MVNPDPDSDLEEAHSRIDEHERRLEDLDKRTSPEALGAFAQGSVTALLAAVKDDARTDREVVKAIGELVACLKELVDELKRHP